MKFKRGTRIFSVYDNAKDLAKFLRDPNTRKELLSMGYDPSVNASKRIRDPETDRIVREYDDNIAERKFQNDKILKKFLGEHNEYYDRNKRNIDSGNKHLVMYPSNSENAGYMKDGKYDDGGFNYHGYKVENYSPDSKNIDINGIKYEVGLTPALNRNNKQIVDYSLDFGAFRPGKDKPGSYDSVVVNKPENMKPLFNAIYDTVSDYSPNKISYSAAIGGGDDDMGLKSRINDIINKRVIPTDEERKFLESQMSNGKLRMSHNQYDDLARKGKLPSEWQKIYNHGLRKQNQRLMLYGRQMDRILPGATGYHTHSKHEGDRYHWDLSNANWNQARKNLGY